MLFAYVILKKNIASNRMANERKTENKVKKIYLNVVFLNTVLNAMKELIILFFSLEIIEKRKKK